MATLSSRARRRAVHYPDSDGKPMGETPRHIKNIMDLYQTIDVYLVNDPQAFVAADIMLYYVEGNPRKHLSPDVFVTWRIPKHIVPERRLYLTWKEGKGPDLVIEVTSKSTRHEDLVKKFEIYRDILRVKEYFLFDPYAEYLDPPLQGYRLQNRRYAAIRPIKGRLPSKLLGLHLEAAGEQLRLYDPASGQRLLTEQEKRQQAEITRTILQDENDRLRRENEELRRRLGQRNGK
jgi:Uma2 family endonuclease